MNEKLRKILSILPWVAASTAVASSSASEMDDDTLWQQVYDARTTFYEKNIGQFPDDILKMGNMTGVWPGGGLFVLQADKIGKGLWAYTTYGLSNSDMPASTMLADFKTETDEQGRASKYSGTVQSKEQAKTPDGSAGYGYEMLLIAKENTEWPLWFMQWTVNAEILNDTGILDRVKKYNGLTVQDIQIGENEYANFLIATAQQPIPKGSDLPNGKMELLVATVITDEEMQWSIENGRDALLAKLIESGIGQVSDLNRNSVIK